MNIDVLPTAQSATTYDFSGKVSVIIDVLRATSVITSALNSGATAVYPVSTIDEALQLKKTLSSPSLLCGERNADRIEGFDLGNSPQHFTPSAVCGKNIILTTTNGTLAFSNSLASQNIIAASLLNYVAVAEQLLCLSSDICLVCAGNNGTVSFEDSACASLILNHIVSRYPRVRVLSDFAHTIVPLATLPDLPTRLRQGQHCQKLVAKGYSHDVEFCLSSASQTSVIPTLCYVSSKPALTIVQSDSNIYSA